MSLSHIKDRQEPTIFGRDLNVLLGDTTINGNVVVQGSINGISDQGQDTNNIWSGTNNYSNERPTSSIQPFLPNNAVNKSSMNNILSTNSVITKNATWSGADSFTQRVTVPINVNPSSSTDAVSGQYLFNIMLNKYSSFFVNNQTWTGSNSFVNKLPTRNNDEIASGSAATKKYVDDTTISTALGNALSSVSQTNLTNYNFGVVNLAHEIQIIGGGGGGTSGSNINSGVSGGCASTAILFLLTYSPLGQTLNGYMNFGRFDIEVGENGIGQNGCSNTATNGLPSIIRGYSASGLGFDASIIQIMQANAGSAFQGNCGQSGTANGGVYSNINSTMIQPYMKCNGRNGVQNAGEIYQFAGYNRFGAGATSIINQNGYNGYKGGYTITSYQI